MSFDPNNLVYERDLTGNESAETEFRKEINNWASSIKGHGIRGFGGKITFRSIFYTPVYRILLNSQFEIKK